MALAGKTVLVTGATGFVGGRLAEKLVIEHGVRVRTLVRNFATAVRIARFPVEIVQGDMTDEAAVQRAVQGCDAVFHCAYESQVPGDRQKRKALDGTRNICLAVLRERVPRMVHVSSFAVYGPTLNGDLTETSPWQRSDHPYTHAKRAAERLVMDLHAKQGLPVVVLQPTIVYGPFCKPWTLRPVQDLKTGLVPLVNGGHGYCNAVYIDDVADAMIRAATQPDVLGEVFLISGERPVSWKEFYGAFEAALDTCATVDITEDRLREMARDKAKHRPGIVSQVAAVARHPEVFALMKSIIPVQATLKAVKRTLPERQWRALKSRLLRPRPNGRECDSVPNSAQSRPIHIPNDTLLALYRSKTFVRIDKAKQKLGYAPALDFSRGMALTGEFIHWANLV